MHEKVGAVGQYCKQFYEYRLLRALLQLGAPSHTTVFSRDIPLGIRATQSHSLGMFIWASLGEALHLCPPPPLVSLKVALRASLPDHVVPLIFRLELPSKVEEAGAVDKLDDVAGVQGSEALPVA